MLEKVYKKKIANVDELWHSVIASLKRGKNLINVWLTQKFDSGMRVLRACVSARRVLRVDTLKIFCDWNKPRDLLWMTISLFVIKM